jgi:telomere length regulation protein
MADFLTAVSTRKVKPEPVAEIQSLSIKDAVAVDSAESTLDALKNQPDSNTLSSILKFLSRPKTSLLTPEPVYASIAHQLVSDTLPNYWRVLEQRPSWAPDANVLPRILRNPTGIGHLITRLRSLITGSRQGNTSELIADVLGVLDRVFDTNTSYLVWRDIQAFGKNDVQKKLMWKEYIVQVGSGRLVSVVAEAEDVLKGQTSDREASWIADGNRFADFLARNIVNMLQRGGENAECLAAAVELCSKVLGLGYTGELSQHRTSTCH